ncbi:hypothetical protein FALBO_13700 [Fusarium albosuccineum]|uniref:Uncharacterized protein n=1 Tax=Fusarium albosuccineum TaxID=1237068 RepID=A0A8H4L049_9HYPO|nr:hypothetical protein FALBO_13700 [Fusarium albosuccineum]
MVLGYPAPIIVNWKRESPSDDEGVGPAQPGTVSGTLHFLDWAANANNTDDKLTEDDLVLVLDANSVWLQLPPSLVLERYFRINARANYRITQLYDTRVPDLMRQTIIAPAQKACVAPSGSVSNLHCHDMPESTLPTNVYGPLTDYRAMGWKYVRPKYINDGSFMGPSGDMRRLFRRVKDKMNQDMVKPGLNHQVRRHQGIFSQVFGEQEVWRRATGGRYPPEDPAKMTAARDEFEYHVGLDYTQDLFHPTCYAESDGSFIALADEEVAKKESSRRGSSPPRIQIPGDVAKLDNPLAMFGDGFSQARYGSANVPLYTDLWTTSVPVALHHGATRNGLKERRVTWWDKTWYFPYLRMLLDMSIYADGSDPLASFTTGNNTLQVWGYGSTRHPRLPKLFAREEHTEEWVLQDALWNAICASVDAMVEGSSPWYNEVFRDGKGPL